MSEGRNLLWVGTAIGPLGDRFFLEISGLGGGLHWKLLDENGDDITEDHWVGHDPEDDSNWELLFEYLVRTLPSLAAPRFPDEWNQLPTGAYVIWIGLRASDEPLAGSALVTASGEMIEASQLEEFLFGPGGL
jgi:hypothetical protein